MTESEKRSPRILHAALLAVMMLLASSSALSDVAEQVFRVDSVDPTLRLLSIRGEDLRVSDNVTIDLERVSGARNRIRFADLEPRQYVRLTVRQGLVTRITVLDGLGDRDGVL